MDVKGAQALRERLAEAARADGARGTDVPEAADVVATEVDGDPTGATAHDVGELGERELLPAA